MERFAVKGIFVDTPAPSTLRVLLCFHCLRQHRTIPA